MRKLLSFFLFLVTALPAHAGLPSQLDGSDLDRIIEVVGFGGTSRLLRSAEVYESWPGVKFGVEVALVSGRDVSGLGDGTGTISGFLPSPRIYIAKGLIYDFEIIFNFFPESDFNPVTSVGAILKHTFYQETSNWMSSAVYFGLTSLNAFSGGFTATNLEVGLLISKDYVRLKPFFGMGVLFSQGTLAANLLATNSKQSSWGSTMHLSFGTEIELPISLSAQIDLFNLAFGGSILVGKSF